MAVAFVALIAALSGTAVALPGKNKVDSGDIKNKQVKRADLANNAVTSSKVKNNSLLAQDFKAGELPAGPKGNKGDKGDTGAPGSPGTNGVSGYERIVQSGGGGASTSKSLSVPCPAGKKVIGGGARTVSGEGAAFIDESYPVSETAFYGETRTVGGAAVNHGIVVVAICAAVG